jgi:tetratricopeptide (TPR) repeat protein
VGYCYNCGFQLTLGTENFCPKCGIDLKQQRTSGRGSNSSIDVKDTKGGVSGVGFSGNRNIIDTELGGYTVQGNVIHLHVNSLSSEVLEKIMKTPSQVDITSKSKSESGTEYNKDIKKVQEATAISRQASQVLDEISRIEKKEGTPIQGIKSGDLQISRNELSLKDNVLKGNEHYYRNEYQEAIIWYDKAIQIDANNVDAWNNKGVVLDNLGKYTEAIECYDKAIEIDPNDALAWYNKGITLDNLGKYTEAIEWYDKAIEIDPNYASAWYNKGITLNKLGRHNEAIECYDNAIGINPNDASAWGNKGAALYNLGRYKEAIGCCDEAIEIDPNYASAWYNKGVILDKLGRHNEAIECNDKAIGINPNDASAWYNRACYKVKKGDIDNGLFDLKKAIEINKEQIVKLAKQDPDFEAIRNDDRFKALIKEDYN